MPTLKHLKKGQSDPTLKESGVWFEFFVPDVAEPLKLRLRSLVSDKVRMWEHARYRAQRRYYLNDTIPPIEVIDQNEIDKLAEVMVTDWNVVDEEGNPVPCDVESVRAAMAELPDTRREAMNEAAKHGSYRQAEVIAIAKNSALPSSLSSATVAK